MSAPDELERLGRDAELGPLLRRANQEYGAGLDEAAAFRRVAERLAAEERRPRPRTHAVAALGLACAAAAGWLVWLQAGRVETPALVVGPEISAGERALGGQEPALQGPVEGEGPPRPEPAREGQDPVAPIAGRGLEAPADEGGATAGRAAVSRDALSRDALEATARPERRAPARERSEPARLERSEREPREPARQEPPERARPSSGGASGALGPESGSSREDCLELARRGDPRAAERCFEQRARGSGLGAEMALYEMARLRRDVLRDEAGALAALSAYRERFERGSLRNEVDLSRVELLARLGRSAEALRESAALLAGSAGRERAAELHLLRGEIYRGDLRDLRAAAAEYAQAEALGGSRGAEASRRLGACLEGLGDEAGALAAYRRYVSDPSRPHVAEVSRRIESLAAAAER